MALFKWAIGTFLMVGAANAIWSRIPVAGPFVFNNSSTGK